MDERVYRLAAWGEDLTPAVWHQLVDVARELAGDGLRVEVVEVALAEDMPEFDREVFGRDGTWRVTGDGSPDGADIGGAPGA